MRSDAIIIVGVGFQDPTQMHLAQDNDVVQTLTVPAAEVARIERERHALLAKASYP